MTMLFFILVTLASFLLGFVVLVQNPKGGGLAGTIGGFNNQIMGVKQTNDALEKGTWLFATIIGVLCIVSTLFFKGSTATIKNNPIVPATTQPAANPANSAPATPGAQK
ncbi:MAG TPA: preprotein translocase subunit SecG [Chitinophagaceae bacterium]|nr:preprotein translocase subunit SecG [Chitinophagaceae bacterium]